MMHSGKILVLAALFAALLVPPAADAGDLSKGTQKKLKGAAKAAFKTFKAKTKAAEKALDLPDLDGKTSDEVLDGAVDAISEYMQAVFAALEEFDGKVDESMDALSGSDVTDVAHTPWAPVVSKTQQQRQKSLAKVKKLVRRLEAASDSKGAPVRFVLCPPTVDVGKWIPDDLDEDPEPFGGRNATIWGTGAAASGRTWLGGYTPDGIDDLTATANTSSETAGMGLDIWVANPGFGGSGASTPTGGGARISLIDSVRGSFKAAFLRVPQSKPSTTGEIPCSPGASLPNGTFTATGSLTLTGGLMSTLAGQPDGFTVTATDGSDFFSIGIFPGATLVPGTYQADDPNVRQIVFSGLLATLDTSSADVTGSVTVSAVQFDSERGVGHVKGTFTITKDGAAPVTGEFDVCLAEDK